MPNHTLRSSIWFHALFRYIYPFLLEKSYIKSADDGSLFDEAIRHLSGRNTYFQKFSLPEDFAENGHAIEKIVALASSLSRMDDVEEREITYRPMKSVFSELFGNEKKKDFVTSLKRLQLDHIMPVADGAPGNFDELMANFFSELARIDEDEQLIHLLEKYFWCVAGTTADDISLYDEMKTTAAIAVSLYDEYLQSEEELDVFLENAEDPRLALIHGDVSGIQNFIFNIPSKGAAKSLKGRSVYISLLSDVIVRYIIDKLDLYPTNLLYNGGGNFFILAPYHKLPQFKNIRKTILQHLLHAHAGEIYFAMDAVPVATRDFKDFARIWDEAKSRANRLKKKKWSELDLEENFAAIFGPLDEGRREPQICKVCGSFGEASRIHKKKLEDELQICHLCYSFVELTNELKTARFFIYKKVQEPIKDRIDSYNDIFRHYGYSIHFANSFSGEKEANQFVYTINNTNFLEKNCSGFHFGAYELPFDEDSQITFEELAEHCVKNGLGDKKLAHLKLDVDNLGSLFGIGLGNRRSISRVSVISRMLGIYFSGYIHHLMKENGWSKNLYVVFSGGDDTYLIGTWNETFLFAKKFYDDFRKFTCHNPDITFSAGIRVFHYDYPVIRAAALTEDALDQAKDHGTEVRPGMPPRKNKLSFLGEIFNWTEFDIIRELEDILEKMVLEYDNRSLLKKVKLSTSGFKKILQDSTKGTFQNIKFWRLAYYLREIHHKAKKDPKKTDYAELIIEKYREIVIHNIFKAKDEEKIKQIMIVPAAVKWAEMATRVASVEEDG